MYFKIEKYNNFPLIFDDLSIHLGISQTWEKKSDLKFTYGFGIYMKSGFYDLAF